MTTGQQIVDFSMQYQTKLKPEVKYLWNGKTMPRVDCSGFASFVLDHFGIAVPDGTAAQEAWAERNCARPSTAMEALVTPGVILFGSRHVGFAVGDGNSIDMRSKTYNLAAYDATINFPFKSVRGFYLPGVSYKPVDYLSVELGDHNPVVGWVQQALKNKGYVLLVDDDFGSKTRDVVLKWQWKRGLVQDGVAGPITQKSLGL